jgi:peptide-methionine (S)-S-oxide reductase
MYTSNESIRMPTPMEALPGRDVPMPVADKHYVNGHPLKPPFPQGMQQIVFGMGCFWGAERRFWSIEGVYTTAVGYAGGYTPNPTYREVCSGQTGHNEVVLVVFEPAVVSIEALLVSFWEGHDPTQGMRQGFFFNDTATTEIYTCSDEQQQLAEQSRCAYQEVLSANHYGTITTEILHAPLLYYAEDYHQQYLAKEPAGYCGLGGIGVPFPTDG